MITTESPFETADTGAAVVSKVEIRLCENQRRAKVETSDLGGSVGSNLDFLVVTLTTANGSASSFGWAARGARTAASVAAEILNLQVRRVSLRRRIACAAAEDCPQPADEDQGEH